MKKRHIIPLAIITMAISCNSSLPNPDQDQEPGTTEPQDTTSSDTLPPTIPWEEALDTTLIIPGIPTN